MLLPQEKNIEKLFSDVASEWSIMVKGKNIIKNFDRAEKSRVKGFVNVLGSKLLSHISYNDIEDWINQRLEKGIAVGTINREMKTFKWIVDYGIEKGYSKSHPMKGYTPLKGANVRQRWLTEAEISLLVSTAQRMGDDDLVDVIELAINTGFRKGNLERLTARDVVNNQIVAKQTKSGTPYSVPIAPSIVPTLQRLIRQHPTENLLNTVKLDARFRDAVRTAGLYQEKGNIDNVTIHVLRHTFAALYIKRGGDIYKLSKLLGHSSISITEKVYAHVCPKEMDAQAPLMSTNIQRTETVRDAF